MSLILFLLLAAILFSMAVVIGQKKNVIPIVMQLLIAIIAIPILTFLFSNYGVKISSLVNANPYVGHFYKFNFAILIGFILLECVDGKIDKGNIKIAIGSFMVPFISGLIVAYFYLPSWSLLTAISIALLFSITAVPVLHMLLKSLNYPVIEIKKLVQVAIMIDLICWVIFSITKDYSAIMNNIYTILLGALPFAVFYILKLCKCKIYNNAYVYGLLFFITIFVLEYCKLNVLVFGILYVMSCYLLKQHIAVPIKEQLIINYQKWVAIPFILTVGMSQININTITNNFQYNDLLLLVFPILTKVLGNYAGLYWNNHNQDKKQMWNQAILLNTRGLTEIVFLNMLFNFNIISEVIYLVIMIMGLISTVLPLFFKHKKEV